jgi:redox-sensitive bicupin YhaK (pirin superfamily)
MLVRKSVDRGYAYHGWLESYHSFSFAEYFDRNHMRFSVLRVMNDDIIAPSRGFGMHAHRDMEIVTYILQGELEHKDNLGNSSIIKAGDVQCMTAGSGIMHSEVNASELVNVHLLQIWVMPNRDNLEPSYEEMHFSRAQKLNRWCLIASGGHHLDESQKDTLKVHQDIRLYATILDADVEISYVFAAHRSVYLHLARGTLEIGGQTFESGDAVMLDGKADILIKASSEAELLLFDLPLHQTLGQRSH